MWGLKFNRKFGVWKQFSTRSTNKAAPDSWNFLTFHIFLPFNQSSSKGSSGICPLTVWPSTMMSRRKLSRDHQRSFAAEVRGVSGLFPDDIIARYIMIDRLDRQTLRKCQIYLCLQALRGVLSMAVAIYHSLHKGANYRTAYSNYCAFTVPGNLGRIQRPGCQRKLL